MTTDSSVPKTNSFYICKHHRQKRLLSINSILKFIAIEFDKLELRLR